MRHTKKISIEQLIENHSNDPRYDTSEYNETDLTARSHNAVGIIPLYTPGSGAKLPGVVGFFDFREKFNELTETTGVKKCDSSREVYHPPPPKFLAPYEDVTDWFDVRTHTTSLADRLPRGTWPRGQPHPSEQSAYWSKLLHEPDWLDTASEVDIEPADIHDKQTGLTEFEDASQIDVNPDGIKVTDGRISDLPVFVDRDEAGALSKYHPDKGDRFTCDHCGANHPWGSPIERGVEGTRPGGIQNGNPEYDHCDPDQVNLKRCDCCGCPRCDSKSLRYRRTKVPAFACNHCELQFTDPVHIDGDAEDAERAKLLWKCRFCTKATQAPFRGIPEELLKTSD